jgi:uncharacterized protein YndB with AHSA1/START domain
MNTAPALQISTPNDREIVITRQFAASRQSVFDAHTRPELIKRWLLGPEGWTMPVCEVDLRVGGRYRYVWSHPEKGSMGMSGVYREIVAPERLVATEKFDQSWYPGEALDTLILTERNDKTILTQIMSYESKQARDIALSSGMTDGMSAGYDRLDMLLQSTTT